MFQFVLGVLMGLMMIYLLLGLLPSARRRQQDLEQRLKSGGGAFIPMSCLRRVVGMLLCGLLAAQLFAGAFHDSLSSLTGISPLPLFIITFFLLPLTSLFLGIRANRLIQKKPGPEIKNQAAPGKQL